MIDDLGLLVARVTFGASYASHGAQKALGWFDGPGPKGAAGFMESLGFKPGEKYAEIASYGEIVAGSLMALGLGGPIGPSILIAGMLVAATTVHAKNGYYAAKGGIEVPVLYGASAVALASSGYGKLSFDHLFGLDRKLRNPTFTALALAAGVAAGYAALASRDLSPPDGTLASPTIKGSERNGESVPTPAPATN